MDAKAKRELVDFAEKKLDALANRYPHISPFSDVQVKLAIAFICRMNGESLIRIARQYEREAKRMIKERVARGS